MSSPAADSPLSAGRVLSHLGVMVALSAVLGLLVGGLAIPFAGALGVVTKSAANGLDNLPQQLKATPLPQRTRMLAADGRTIATFYDQNRVNVKLDQVAPIMRKAIVAIEDYRFYQHGALDLKGTLRAFITNSTGAGSVQGGSSITQQMAKLTALQQAVTPAQRKAATADTYQRKILELRHAIAFEQHYSKNWILQRYLNIAYFGDGAYGIQAAARHYFGVYASDLKLGQAALLAGLVKNPVGFDPTDEPAAAKARRDVVLDRMAQLNVISDAAATKQKNQPLNLHLLPTRNGCLNSLAPFFCDYALRYLLADPSLGKTREARKQLINAGGLTIKTTVDLRFSRAASTAVRDHVYPTDQAIGALAMVHPGTGDVKAIAQSRPMGRDKGRGQTFLNYSVPSDLGDSAGFQAGSTFKLFVLTAALEQGLSPYTTINSPPQVHLPQNEFETCNGPYQNYDTWDPTNSTTSGKMNMYSGMQQSVNTFFAQLEQRTGLCEPFELAKKMGVQLTDPAHEEIPSFTLGVADVSPIEMAGAYATVAARGMYCPPKPISVIYNKDDKVFKTYENHCARVMSENTADTIADILRGVMSGGGFGAALAFDKPSAGKTGTTQDNKAVWFDGFTPDLAAVAMVAGANNEGHPITLNGQTIHGVYTYSAHGSTTAGPIWGQVMAAVSPYLKYIDFTPPTNVRPTSYVSAPKTSTAKPTKARHHVRHHQARHHKPPRPRHHGGR